LDDRDFDNDNLDLKNLIPRQPFEPDSDDDVLVDPDATEPSIKVDPLKAGETSEALTVAASLNAETLRALFGNRNFVPLWLGQLVSYIGDQFTLIAALAVIGPLSGGNALATGLLAVSLAAPQILFGLIGGVLVDKQDRKWTMIVSDLVRGLAMFSLLLVNHDPSRLWIFYPAIFVIGVAQTLFYPARASALPAIVRKRDLAGANALLEACFVVALIFGAGGAGILIERFGEDLAFAFNGSAYLFSALMIFLMSIPRHRAPPAESEYSGFNRVWSELREGLSYIWHTRSMRYIMGLSVMVAAGLGAVIILVLDYLNKTLNIGAGGFGAVIGILGVGIVVGGILIQRLSRFLPTNRLVALAMLLDGIAVGAFILHPPFGLVLGFTALIGFSVIIARAVLGTLTQAIPPEEFRGRVQGAFNLIFSAPLTVAIGVAGLLLQLFTRKYSYAPAGLPVLSGELSLSNVVSNQEIVFGIFALALLLTAWLAVNMLRGIDEAIYSETT
jgi:DHA3 family macrolide efflux protein-like MFS transporter